MNIVKKTKILFSVIAITIVSSLVIVFGLVLSGSRVQALEVIDPWNFCAAGEDCSGDYVDNGNGQNESVPVVSEIEEEENHEGCVKESELTRDTSACCCSGLAHAYLQKFRDYEISPGGDFSGPAREFSHYFLMCTNAIKACDADCESDQELLLRYSLDDDTVRFGLSPRCRECIGRVNIPDYFVWFPPFIDAYAGAYNAEACASETVFRCASGDEGCKEKKDESHCPYPAGIADSGMVSIKSSGRKETELRKALEEALGKLGPDLGRHLSKLEGLNDKEFKKLLKKLDPDLNQIQLDGTPAFSTFGSGGENIIITNEDHPLMKREGELANFLAHELSHFHKHSLGQEDSRFVTAWFQASGGYIYDSGLDGKSTWPDGSRSKNGCVNTYACTDSNEDVAETVRRAVKDPAKFKALFLDTASPSYDARFRAKLEVLAKFGFITNAQLGAILCVGK